MPRRALLLALVLAVACAPALAAPRVADAGGPRGDAWTSRAPVWLDPGTRSPATAPGDAPRALAPAAIGPRRWARRRTPRPRPQRRDGVRRPRLAVLGRRQSDGG